MTFSVTVTGIAVGDYEESLKLFFRNYNLMSVHHIICKPFKNEFTYYVHFSLEDDAIKASKLGGESEVLVFLFFVFCFCFFVCFF